MEKRPIIGIFLDSETNGLDFLTHQLLEIAYIIVDLETGKQLTCYESVIKISKEQFDSSLPESLQINHFTESEIEQGKPLQQVAQEIIAEFEAFKVRRGSALFICQNPSFDRSFFSSLIAPSIQESHQWPYHWLDLASMYFAVKLKTKGVVALRKGGLSKDMIAGDLLLGPEKKPHRAMNGAKHLLACYETLLGYPLANQ